MDPNAILAQIRAVINLVRDDETARTLDAYAELEKITDEAEALDEWLSGGGFLPTEWERKS